MHLVPENAVDRADREELDRILELAFAFRMAKLLMSAVELEVFHRLGRGSARIDALLDALTSIPAGNVHNRKLWTRDQDRSIFFNSRRISL
jgi:hypothetical protein